MVEDHLKKVVDGVDLGGMWDMLVKYEYKYVSYDVME